MNLALLAGIACMATALAYVLAPLIWPERFGARPRATAQAEPSLAALRDDLFAAIVELDFDHAVGKTDEDEYRLERAELKRQALAVLRLLDEQAEGTDADAVEREIRAARERLQADRAGAPAPAHHPAALDGAVAPDTCPACGRAFAAEDRFCPRCGRPRAELPDQTEAIPDRDSFEDEVEREVRALRRQRAGGNGAGPRTIRVSGPGRSRRAR